MLCSYIVGKQREWQREDVSSELVYVSRQLTAQKLTVDAAVILYILICCTVMVNVLYIIYIAYFECLHVHMYAGLYKLVSAPDPMRI